MSVYERELLAVVYAVQKWGAYLTHKPFVIKSDQKSIKYLLDQKLNTPFQQVWVAKLMGFDFEIQYKQGSTNNAARKVFERNAVTCNLMITRLGQFGLPGDAVDLFFSMLVSGYMPNRFTLSGVVSTCAELEFLSVGKELHSWVIESGLALDLSAGCSLVEMYAKCGLIENSRKVFNGMSDHNVMSCTALMVDKNKSGKPLDCFAICFEVVLHQIASRLLVFLGLVRIFLILALGNMPQK